MVPSSQDKGMWACMMVTSTMTPALWSINSIQPLPHACRQHLNPQVHGHRLHRHYPAVEHHDQYGETVEDANHGDQFRVGWHHSHLVVHQGWTNAGPVQETGQVLSEVQNTCKFQVMLRNLTKYNLPTYCSGSFITLAKEEGLSQALCETQPPQNKYHIHHCIEITGEHTGYSEDIDEQVHINLFLTWV